MKPNIRLLIYRGLIILALVCEGAVLGSTAYLMGRLAGALDPVRNFERPMCVAGKTAIRANPTGYIIGQVPAGEMVWFVKLDLPFAQVAYYDGSAWIEGTITATSLIVCE